MKKAGTLATHALGTFLALQAPQATADQGRQLAEPFQTDISEILRGDQGQLTRVTNPTQLAESYTPGSSVVVEGDFGLTERVLQELQREINEKYAHLNILVYLAEDGRSFDEYNGQRIRSTNLCGTNPGLAYLRDSFYEGADQAAQGNHIIFYLAAKEPGYDYNMVCTLISPQMAEVIGSDDRIFVKGAPLFESVFAELKQDFNKLGAIHAFLRGVDQMVQEAQREESQRRNEHLTRVSTLQLQLENNMEAVESAIQGFGKDISTSTLYTSFITGFTQAQSLLDSQAEYISQETLERADTLVNDVSKNRDAIIASITGFSSSEARILEIRGYIDTLGLSPYAQEISTELHNLELSLDQAEEKLKKSDIDYFLSMQEVESNYSELESKIQSLEFWDGAKDLGLGGAAAGFMATLGALNRRKKRINSRDEFLGEIEKLRAGLNEMKRVFEEEIEGNTESIEMFFGDQTGITGEKIQELKTSVAYISVLLPKIDEILHSVQGTIGISAKIRTYPYERAIALLHDEKHIIDPSKSQGDKQLLEKINGAEIKDFSELIENISQTLPELIQRLDKNIEITKTIFAELETASEDSEKAYDQYKNTRGRFSHIMQTCVSLLGENFSFLSEKASKVESSIDVVVSDNSGTDILGEYQELSQINVFLEYLTDTFQSLEEYIQAHNPSQYRSGLEIDGYNTGVFLDDIQQRFQALFLGIEETIQSGDMDHSKTDACFEKIYEFYRSMSSLHEAHNELVGESEKADGLKNLQAESEKAIQNHLGERLGNKTVLFEEDGKGISQVYASVDSAMKEAQDAIQSGKSVDAYHHLGEIRKLLAIGHEVVKQSQYTAVHYDENSERLQSMRESLLESKNGASKKLEELLKRYDSAICILRDNDPSAEEGDEDISNNIEEIDTFLENVEAKFQKGEDLLSGGKFLELQQELGGIYALLQKIDEHIQEIEHVYQNVTKVDEENPGNYTRMTDRISALQSALKNSAKVTPMSQVSLQNLQERSEILRDDIRSQKPNPYAIQETLHSIETELTKLETSFQRDGKEFKEFIAYIEQLIEIFENLQSISEELSQDTHPDSEKAKQVFDSLGSIQNQISQLEQKQNSQIEHWYELTDEVEELIEFCEAQISTLYQEEEKRKQAYQKIQTAAKSIKKAKRWSGRYVSISGSVGESDLRSAHNNFQTGNFDDVIRLAIRASKTAQGAISDAEKEDRKIKRKKDAEAAARRRRQSSYTSSSSSSYGGFSGGGGGGFSGFSGGGGF